MDRDKTAINGILREVNRLEAQALKLGKDEFISNITAQRDALESFILIGEEAIELSDSLKSKFPNIPWSSIERLSELPTTITTELANDLWTRMSEDIPIFKADLQAVILL